MTRRAAPAPTLAPASALVLLLGLTAWPLLGRAQQATPVAGAATGGATPTANGTILYPLPGDAVYPAGIADDPNAGVFYTGSAVDGTIYRVDLGSGKATVFSPAGADGRTKALGMKVDRGRLFVAGGDTGKVFVYDTGSGGLIDTFDNGLGPNTFLNDIAIGADGNAYITDSFNPLLFRVVVKSGSLSFETFFDMTGTGFQFASQGYNASGIVATADGRYLLLDQTNTGRLYRIDPVNFVVTPIDLGGVSLAGDGLLLDGQILYVVRAGDPQRRIARVALAPDFARGTVDPGFTDPSLRDPTTIAKVGNRLLVVNSQLDRHATGNPELPFTISSILIPGGAPVPPAAAPVASPTATPTAVPTATPVASPVL